MSGWGGGGGSALFIRPVTDSSLIGVRVPEEGGGKLVGYVGAWVV